MLLDYLFSNPLLFVLVAAALVVSLSIHEFAHAFAADLLGDPTPRSMGRLTLDPRAHLDPLGSVLLIVAGFGWGKPVITNSLYFKNPRRDMAITAFAGPLSNIAMSILISIVLFVFRFMPFSLPFIGIFVSFLYLTAFYNLILAFFNLIPISPLDGFKVVLGLLPHDLAGQWLQMEAYGNMILLVLILTRSTSAILTPIVNVTARILGLLP